MDKIAKVGAPPFFDNPEDMQRMIDEYFETRSIANEHPTISGLCYVLGFASRQSFYDYEEKPEFSYTINRARLRMEAIYEGKLHGDKCTGAIFALKNFGWSDRTEIDQKTEWSGTITGMTIK